MKKKILIAVGTRPEIIKVASLYLTFRDSEEFEPVLLLTGQQGAMADDILDFFQIQPDVKLTLERTSFSLSEFTSLCLAQIDRAIEDIRPDLVLVQGDTSTSFCAALSAYYRKVPVAHLEAGLRTYNKYSPFPEENLRRMNSVLADFHFAPTVTARDHLLSERTGADAIHVVGNSVIDSLIWATQRLENDAALKAAIASDIAKAGFTQKPDRRMVLITGHRRESFGEAFEQICLSIKGLSQSYPGCDFVYPVHLNPNVRDPVMRILSGLKNVYLIEPVNYPHFVYLMQSSYFILTDSGGIQEEAPTLGKPVLVMREVTERPEAVASGCAKIVGTANIVAAATELLEQPEAYHRMAHVANPYGDGTTARQVLAILRDVV